MKIDGSLMGINVQKKRLHPCHPNYPPYPCFKEKNSSMFPNHIRLRLVLSYKQVAI